jgi:predicted nuclease of predicted toxin-antitoxin system
LVECWDIDAPDKNIIDWAKKHNYVIFTHDLDFGTALALTKAEKPSVVQVRTQNATILYLSNIVPPAIKTHADLLEKGALLVIDEDKKRIRILPV